MIMVKIKQASMKMIPREILDLKNFYQFIRSIRDDLFDVGAGDIERDPRYDKLVKKKLIKVKKSKEDGEDYFTYYLTPTGLQVIYSLITNDHIYFREFKSDIKRLEEYR